MVIDAVTERAQDIRGDDELPAYLRQVFDSFELIKQQSVEAEEKLNMFHSLLKLEEGNI
jgi:hypothetical protein